MRKIINDEELVYTDQVKALAVHRSLNTTIVVDEEDCFATTSSIKGIITNRGRCENIVGKLMVDKLKLSTKNHPHPCKL